tara:strand:- start:11846 stop:12484 length:639 start_codon:yes stop_codon:yes gene_type:complete
MKKSEDRELTTFEKLSAINVNKKAEKKNNLTYLSWAWAWSEVKKACPDATYQMHETDYDEALGFMCHSSVTIQGETLSMWLPVMDGANKAMKKEEYSYATRYGDKQVAGATMFDVNKTMMRCLVKNLAMFGMGIYIYAGEDLPEPSHEVLTPKEVVPKEALMELNDEKMIDVLSYVATHKAKGLEWIINNISKKYKVTTKWNNQIKKTIDGE